MAISRFCAPRINFPVAQGGYLVNDCLKIVWRSCAIAALATGVACSLAASPPVKSQSRRAKPARAVAAGPAHRPPANVARPAPALWPPVADKPGSPVFPTAYPNVWVRFTPSPAAAAPADRSLYVMPGTAPPASGMVPRAAQHVATPLAIPLPGGGYAVKVDDSRTEYLVAACDATGGMTLICQSPAESAAKGVRK